MRAYPKTSLQSLSPMLLQTRRLDLFPCSLEVAQAAVNDRDDLERLLDVRVPQGWPAPDLQGFLPVYAYRADKAPSIRILGKSGMQRLGTSGSLVRWTLRNSESR